MNISTFVRQLGFKQSPLAWGGVHPSGAILLRTWRHEAEESPHRVGVLLPVQKFSSYRQNRKTHLQRMWRGTVAGYTMVVTQKPGTSKIGWFSTEVVYPITQLVGDEQGIHALLAPAISIHDLSTHMQTFRVKANPSPEPSFLDKGTTGTTGTAWSDEELEATALAYAEMMGKYAAGTTFRKADYYAELVGRFGRVPGAFERRMQNISYLLESTGLPWLPGLKPQSNVGKNVKPRLTSILVNLNNRPDFPEEITNPEGVYEGARKQVVVNWYERDPTAKGRCIARWGHKCVVCRFDFESLYGALGKGFIHVHHLTPLSSIKETYLLNPEEDLRPVCPNCHAMLHRKRDQVLSIQELQALVGSRSKAPAVSQTETTETAGNQPTETAPPPPPSTH